ncbi:nucleotidyltransferase family protein [Tamlana sp. 2_MG-2023]|uniref:nucleotidyltransferase family protein n=1 Tax=unclassified Tamlana TaxID=2614803 RepID=UPI0026E2A74B|nr:MULTISPECIES: nucleotidyltransferase family protein [unclassified Tamlana]MDO6761201.1 nucleotidyltransferase family protein [Tamlana sp. 2_MG-2023]MDO6791684.1 nucleotidyltransferase family protein [Tamlana sp. 1_MG-2023]
MASSKLPIIILAAGESKRMGTAKQLLPWGNSTLIEYVCKTVLKLSPVEIFVVLGANYSKVKAVLESYPVTILKNESWHLGLGTSISCGVQHIVNSKKEHDGFLMVLGDQPFVDVSHLERLIDAYKPNSNQIVATLYHKNKFGVPVVFDASYANSLISLVEDSGAKHLLKAHSNFVQTVVSDKRTVVDIDSEADYRAYYKK